MGIWRAPTRIVEPLISEKTREIITRICGSSSTSGYEISASEVWNSDTITSLDMETLDQLATAIGS